MGWFTAYSQVQGPAVGVQRVRTRLTQLSQTYEAARPMARYWIRTAGCG